MKNNKDFIYEYSDLNLFQTRVLVLTGRFKGMILEFGASHLVSNSDGHEFSFDYNVLHRPKQFTMDYLRSNPGFNKYLGKLLMAVLKDRTEDADAQAKLDEAASAVGARSKIEIDPSFYPFKRNHLVETIHGVENF